MVDQEWPCPSLANNEVVMYQIRCNKYRQVEERKGEGKGEKEREGEGDRERERQDRETDRKGESSINKINLGNQK